MMSAQNRTDSHTAATTAPLRLGSEEHKQAFCRMFLDTFDPYKPAIVAWPTLEPDAFKRLTSLPIWDLAVQTEGKAALRMKYYAEMLADPLIKEAIALNGFEEQRHKDVLHHMVTFYGIKLEPEPPYPRWHGPEQGFMRTGFGECVDSFFAFGLFALAKRSGFFPPVLVETFEPVIQEECRHILFFTNWVKWHLRNLPPLRRVNFLIWCVRIFADIAKDRLGTAKDVGGGDNFTAKGHEELGADINPRELLEICLIENDRRMARYDSRLPRPKLVPRLVKVALFFMARSKNQDKTETARERA
jgi:hypothetical protein